MADSYSKWVMTTAFANNLQASINSGNKIEWVSIKTSNDTHLFADLAGFNDTTLATASIKQTATINAVSINGNTVTITALFNNQDNQADYYIKTLFLVAKYNGTEFLAGATVANSASTAFRMPAASATEITEFTARPQITVSNSSTISATVDPVAAATNKRVDGLEATLQGEIDDINADKQSLWNTLVNYVTKAGTDTITGVKTFTQTIVGSVTGNAGTSTRLQTPRKLKVNLASTADQTFDGSADQVGIGVDGILPVKNGGSGRADGLANPIVAGLSAGTDLNTLTTSGYYKLDTSDLNIPAGMPNGAILFVANFDATVSYQQIVARQVTASTTKVTVWYRLRYTSWGPWQSIAKDDDVVHNTGDETIVGNKTFTAGVYTNGGLFSKGVEVSNTTPYVDFHYANDIGDYTSRIIENAKGQLTFLTTAGAKMKIAADLQGTADVATKLATARTIAVTGDVTGSGTFDGSGNLTITATESATSRTNTTSTQAGTDGATVTMIDGVTTNSAGEVTGINTKTLTLPPTQTTVTGNAGSATKLQTARTINGVAFDGTANISVNAANDASLVHTTGNETIAGTKTFTSWPVIPSLYLSNGTNKSGVLLTNSSIPNQSDNNVPMAINTGSTLAVGGGEAANSYLAAMAAGAVPIGSASANNEQLVMAGDAAVYIGAGYQDGGTTGKWWAFNQDGTITSPNGNLMQEVVSTTINLYGKGTYFVNDTATYGDHLTLIVSGKVVSVQGTLRTSVAMSGGAYLGEAIVPAQFAPLVARKNTVGLNVSSPGSKVFADVAWSIDGMLSIDNIVTGSNMTAWGTIPAGSQLSFSDTWVIA